MPDEIKWSVGNGGDGSQKRKAKYADIQQVTDKMSKGQIAGVNQWNDMVQILRENGLMEDK